MIQKFAVLAFLAITLLSCSSTSTVKTEHLVIGDSLRASKVGDIYFSGQPTKEDLITLKSQGFSTVINLRNPKEHDEASEKSALERKGIKYYNIPFPEKLAISDAYTDDVFSTLERHKKTGKTLIHCSSGNRVAIWLGAHFYMHHKMSKEDSISTAKKLGLTKERAEKALKRYLQDK